MTIGARKPNESTPLLGQSRGGTASVLRTYGNIVISIVGGGVLGLPYAFKVAGWAAGTGIVVLAGSVSYYCMVLLVRSRDQLVREGRIGIYTYSDLAYETCGRVGQRVVDTLVVISQVGCCVTYLIFIGQNLSSLFFQSSSSKFSTFILFLVPVEIVLACVRSLAGLAPFSIFADICNVLAMTIVFNDDFHLISGFDKVLPFCSWGGLPFALGVAIFCFEGFGMTLTLEGSMREPKKFPKVLGYAFIFITVLYVSFGFVGYLAFGQATMDIITLNLPLNWTTSAVKAALCIALVFTFPVMMYPVHEIFERKLLLSEWFQVYVMPSPRLQPILLNLARGGLVIFAALLAVSVPGFGAFVALVGSTVCAMLAFLLPALLHIRVFKDNASSVERVVDYILMVTGAIFAIYGTYSAAVSMIPSVSISPADVML